MTNTDSHNQKPLKDSLFERIEAEQVCPHSRLFFKTREVTVWSLWLLSVLVGALAVAVSLFVMVHRQYELYEATHENFLTFLVEVMPYAWIVTFGIMVYVAVYNIRHTRHGYRYPVWVILSSSVILSFAGGSALQMFGFGYTVDHLLGANMRLYVSQEKLDERLWQMPEEGRLLGSLSQTAIPESEEIIMFTDVTGQTWKLNISELRPREIELLTSDRRVRLLGQCMGDTKEEFHVCGVFPWMMRKEVTVDQLVAERNFFVQRVSEQAKIARLMSSASDSVSEETSVCATIAPVHRMAVQP